MTKRKFLVDRRALIKQTAGVVAGTLAAPMIGRAEANVSRLACRQFCQDALHSWAHRLGTR